MSSKIYFNPSNKFSIKKSMLNLTTRLHHTITPKHAEKTARNILLTPFRTKPKIPLPEGAVKGKVLSREGVLITYRLGSGPVWILTHGWSGSASQFFHLMEHIARQGYTALAYDHPGHGLSEGKYSHMPAFVSGLQAVLDSVDDFAGLIAHSMGSAAAIECQHHKLIGKPFLFIAPILNYMDYLVDSVVKSGYSLRLFNTIVEQVHEQYCYPVESIDPYNKLKLRSAQTIIVHDEEDRFSMFSISEKAANEMNNVRLVSTQGLGHGRIIKSPQVMKAFNALID